ncbi:BTB domain-containing protein [Pleurotus pulmonarius]
MHSAFNAHMRSTTGIVPVAAAEVSDSESLTPNTLVQGPTPPQSPTMRSSATTKNNGTTLISVSTSFSPKTRHQDILPRLVFLSSDSVHFYVHPHVLTAASTNGFNRLLDDAFRQNQDVDALPSSPLPVKSILSHSSTLNVILHAAYDAPCAQFAPSTDTLVEAIDLLPEYGIAPCSCIYSSTSTSPAPSRLYSLLLSHAPFNPLPIYTLAAHHGLEDLAVACSQHLLSTQFHMVSDHAAIRMGPIYLKRLAFLLLGRVEALKRLIVEPPPLHAPTGMCSGFEQKRLARAWTLAVSSLVWDAKPDLPTSLIEATLRPLGNHLDCHLCQYNLRDRIRDVTMHWLSVKRTI